VANQFHNSWSSGHAQVVGNKYLDLQLTESYGTVGTNSRGIIATGAQIHTYATYGFGTYEWCVRQATDATTPTGPGGVGLGSWTGFFNWVNNSQSEIDFETWMYTDTFDQNTMYVTNWLNPNPSANALYDGSEDATTYFPVTGMSQGFKNYKFVWTPTSISYYVDDSLGAVETTFVPSTPAYIFAQNQGILTADPVSQIGTHHAYVQWIRYTAPGESPPPVPAACGQ